MKLSAVFLCALVAVLLAAMSSVEAGELEVRYYANKCKSVENIVKWHVIKALKANRRTGAALVRLIFHDCFVRGCDGSVLLDKSYDNPHPEKEAPVNIGLAAFDLLEEIKAAVECRCPGVVSCSDILIYAARDAASFLSNGNVHFDVAAGRLEALDGFVSKADEVLEISVFSAYKYDRPGNYSREAFSTIPHEAQAELPDSTDDVEKLLTTFAKKNFTNEELVILTGAHSIGQGHCSSFTGRLTEPPSQIDPKYRDLLNFKCAQGDNPTVDNNVRDEDPDVVAEFLPDFVSQLRKTHDFLDHTFYNNTLDNIVNFHSDTALLNQMETLFHVHEYADNGTQWDEDFSDALVKLSKLPMPAGSKGEIRNKCNTINYSLHTSY
ncbi:hypothetical protein EJB05_26444, partial [Eragrostis curvula]